MRPYGMPRVLNGLRFVKGEKACPCCLHGWFKTRIRGRMRSKLKSKAKRQLKRMARREDKRLITEQLRELC